MRKHRQYALWHWSQRYFGEYVSSGKGNKSKTKQVELHKLKSFCTVQKMKKLPTEWQKLFVKDISDKGLIFQINKDIYLFTSLNLNKTGNPIYKWAEELTRCFAKEDIYMDHRHMKRCSPSLIIGENANQNNNEYHLTSIRVAIIKKTTNRKCWQGCGAKEILMHCCQECKLGQLLQKTEWKFLKKTKNKTTII